MHHGICFQEYPPSVHNMSEAFLALVAALNESSGAERSIRFVLDLVAPQLHGLDLTHVWNLDNPMGCLVKVNETVFRKFVTSFLFSSCWFF
jgi:hypothetical protein